MDSSSKRKLIRNDKKHMNKHLVLHWLWKNQAATKASLASEFGVDKSTLVRIVKQLVDISLIKVADKTTSTPLGGRKALMYDLNSSFGCVLGLEIQPTYYRSVLLDLKGNVIKRKSGGFDEFPSFEKLVFYVLKELSGEFVQKQTVLGISIGLPGWVDSTNQIIKYSVLHHLKNYDFFKNISSKYDIPVIVENDANCCAWGELSINKSKKLSNFIHILGEFHHSTNRNRSDIGVGFGMILNGKVYYGSNFSAGDFKSVFWQKGNRYQFGIPQKRMVNLPKDSKTLREVIKELFSNLSVLICTLNPSYIFIGGDLKNYKKTIESVLADDLKSSYVVDSENQCTIAFSDLDEFGVAFGGAWRFLEGLFALPNPLKKHYKVELTWENTLAVLPKIEKQKKTNPLGFKL